MRLQTIGARRRRSLRSLVLIGGLIAAGLDSGRFANAQDNVLDEAQAQKIAAEKGWLIRRVTDTETIELQQIINGIPQYYATENINSADSVSSDEVWPGAASGLSLNGSGVTLGIWDGGATRTTHVEFTNGRAVQIDSASSFNFHATHVAGTMIAQGVDANARGMSFAAGLDCYDWSSDETEMDAAAAAGLPVSNHSYGFVRGWRFGNFGAGEGWYWWGDVDVSAVEDYKFGFYDSQARDWDQIAFDNPGYLWVSSAGNDRNDTGPTPGGDHFFWDPDAGAWTLSNAVRNPDHNNGYDSSAHQKVGKNGLSVGAVEDVIGGYVDPPSVTMTTFSGWGPADDGRIKPDVSTNGRSLYSSYHDSGDPANDAAYASLSGTSMASPSAAGSLGLLIQHYRATHPARADMLAATLKGLLLHTADECGSADGPDYSFGWGLLNTLAAANLISQDAADPLTITENTLNDGGTFLLNITTDGSAAQLRATLYWTDPPGTPPAPALDPTTKMLVNDLDLRIEDGAATTHRPWVLDVANPSAAATTGDNDTDNVEQVLINSPGTDTFALRVTHKGTLAGTSQDFSLIITGAASIAPVQNCATSCGDLDASGSVNLSDFASFAVCFNQLPASSQTCACSDLNQDGLINLLDFATFSVLFGTSPTATPPDCQ